MNCVLALRQRLNHYVIAIAHRSTCSARRTKNPWRRRRELKLRRQGAITLQVFDRHSIQRAEQRRSHNVVGQELRRFGLLHLGRPEPFQVGSLRVQQPDEQCLVLGEGAGALHRAEGRGEEPDVPVLTRADVEVRAVGERMAVHRQFKRPLPPFRTPFGVGLAAITFIRANDLRLAPSRPDGCGGG